MSKTVLATLAAMGLFACGAPVDFKYAVPRQSSVTLNSPGKASTGSVRGPQPQPMKQVNSDSGDVKGAISGLYLVTALTTTFVNGATLILLDTVNSMTGEPPSSVSGNTAVYGPYTPALSLLSWKLTVTRSGLNHFDYIVAGKVKSADDSTYVNVMTGTHVVALDPHSGEPMDGYGNGTFTISWHDTDWLGQQNRGSVTATYSRLSPTAQATVDLSFAGYTDGSTSATTDATYNFAETPGTGGDFEFSAAGQNGESWSIESRWLDDGAGRSDVRASGGDLGTPGLLNECWDQNFNSQYLYESWDANAGYGDPNTDCVFATAQYTNG